MDRYIAVTQPIKYARHKNHKRVWLTIGLVWAISAAIGLPIVMGLNHTPSRDPTLCMFYNSDFVIYSSLSSFYIPCIIMVFLYYKIFKVHAPHLPLIHSVSLNQVAPLAGVSRDSLTFERILSLDYWIIFISFWD